MQGIFGRALIFSIKIPTASVERQGNKLDLRKMETISNGDSRNLPVFHLTDTVGNVSYRVKSIQCLQEES